MDRIELLMVTSALCFAVSGVVSAQELYKHVDKDGRVTYTDKPPVEVPGKVTRVPIDQSKLAPPAPKQLAPTPREESEYEKIIRRKAPEEDDSELRAARERLESARRALQTAQDSTSPEDWIFQPKGPKGGTLRYPKPEYAERLARLEAEVKTAEEQLAQVERKSR